MHHANARFLTALAVIVAIAPAADAAKTVVWDNSGGTGEWNTAVDNWVGSNLFVTGDTARFDNNSPSGTIFIGQGGSPQAVSPAQLYFHMYGRTWTFTGGDILTGSMLIDWDSNVVFNHAGSLSFPGGTTIQHVRAHFHYRPSGGTVDFGTGEIAFTRGWFHFEPGAAGTVTNDLRVLAGGWGGVLSNADGSYSGTAYLEAGGTLVTGTRPSTGDIDVVLEADAAIQPSRHYNNSTYGIFSGQVDGGGVYNVTIKDGSSPGSITDWEIGLGGPGGWDVNNVVINSPQSAVEIQGGASATYFNGIAGKVVVQAGDLVNGPGSRGSYANTYHVNVPYEVQAGGRVIGTSIAINPGGVAGGAGRFRTSAGNNGPANGIIDVFSGGTIAPGASVGTLAFEGRTNIHPGAVYDWEMGLGGTGDLLNVIGSVGSLSFAGFAASDAWTLNVLPIDPLDLSYTLGDYTILSTAGGITGFDAGNVNLNLPANMSGSVGQVGNDLVFSLTEVRDPNAPVNAIPEPATLVLLALSGLAALRRRRAD